MRRHLAAAIACLVATGNTAFAQTVAITGKTVDSVLVNHGNGFVQASRGTRLASGDIVFVKRGGRAELKYTNGCIQTVKSGRVQTVDQDDCLKRQDVAARASGTPVLGGILIAGAGVGAALALGLTQDFGAPGGGGDRRPNPVSR